MASMSPQPSEPKKPLDINNLMSPPEAPRLDSFGHNASNITKNVIQASKSINAVMSDKRQPQVLLSPPISPAIKSDDNVLNIVSSAKDPILFPSQDVTGSLIQQPLFAREEPDNSEARQIIDRHVSTRPSELFEHATPPAQDDYGLVLYFRSQVMKKFQQNPKSWLQRERALLLADRKAQAKNKQAKLPTILPAVKVQPIRKEAQRVKPVRAPKVSKPAIAKPTAPKPRPIRAGPGPVIGMTPTTAPVGLAKHVRVPSSTPDPSPRRGTTQTRADDDFNSVPDFCPPLESMPSKINSLKMEWKTGITDLSNDPHRHLLHPEELTLASSLRLTAAVYLTSKRRIFVRRLECLRVNKEFRKTDAQQACKIDVNKASKLWTAFERIGWLDKKWVEQYK
ncbi:SWIRM domain-containing protein [Xylaria arbuscula]|uniref:SWIRM domain-containing protein n=1 Tax=Xylaria arbuscula TaxID=114810 RepID=A0A9W8TKK2_9PEZI|nr:SWIRM domain-containing protein [Xylaria arbuscula]KAJ3569800.1 hypothetical protein NPX13_g5958 [Xylaria arbuscula]